MNNHRVLSCPDSAVVCVCEAIQMKVSFVSHNEIGKVIVIVGDLQEIAQQIGNVKKKIIDNKLILTQADKGKTVVILYHKSTTRK
jgi:hypothetical protein